MNTLITKTSADYELLDSGEGEKLERFGKFVLSRPDPQALWLKRLDIKEWKKAHGRFVRNGEGGRWILKENMPSSWSIKLAGLGFLIKPTAFKHVGVFPEQVSNWVWLEKQFQNPNFKIQNKSKFQNDKEVLNLFGYTGGATIACAKAGAKVVHIDGSKSAIAWARENAELSGLKDKPIRWILEDAREFVKREIRRGRKYDGIIMDPPAFGHGPNKEVWKIEEDFLPLLESCTKLLNDNPLFFLINGYAAGYSSIAYTNAMLPIRNKFGGQIEAGELAIEESQPITRLLSCGIYSRWYK